MRLFRLQILGILLLSLVCVQVTGAFGAGPKAIQSSIRKATELFQSDPEASRIGFDKAFRQALELTRPGNPATLREKGFALAAQCIHPNLLPEAEVAVETYLNLYPQGRYRRQVLLGKALIAYACGDQDLGEKTLAEAEAVSHGHSLRLVQYLRFHGLITAGKFRSAEDHLRTIQAQNPQKKTRHELRRFAAWEKKLAAVVDDVQTGKISGQTAIRTLDEAVRSGYMAPLAPKATLLSLQIKDQQSPPLHAWETPWLDQVRVGWHAVAPTVRAKRLETFLKEFPEAPPEMQARALLTLRGIYFSEMDRPAEAEKARQRLALLPGYAGVAEVERLLVELRPDILLSAEGTEMLGKLLEKPAMFPYDNGWLPIIGLDGIRELHAISLLAQDRTGELLKILRLEQDLGSGSFRGIPHRILFLIAADSRYGAYKDSLKLELTLGPKEKAMLEYLLNPLYMPCLPGDRVFISALLLQSRFPLLAIDRLLLALTGTERPRRLEYALALLAEEYQTHRNYVEAQQVWTTLRHLYPKSLWVR